MASNEWPSSPTDPTLPYFNPRRGATTRTVTQQQPIRSTEEADNQASTTRVARPADLSLNEITLDAVMNFGQAILAPDTPADPQPPWAHSAGQTPGRTGPPTSYWSPDTPSPGSASTSSQMPMSATVMQSAQNNPLAFNHAGHYSPDTISPLNCSYTTSQLATRAALSTPFELDEAERGPPRPSTSRARRMSPKKSMKMSPALNLTATLKAKKKHKAPSTPSLKFVSVAIPRRHTRKSSIRNIRSSSASADMDLDSPTTKFKRHGSTLAHQKVYSCPICGYELGYADGITRHIKHEHPDVEFPQEKVDE